MIQIYIDDIIFESTKETLYRDFAKLMQGEFEMSMMGKFTFFLELQIKQSREEIIICQSKYIRELLKRFKMETSKCINTPMSLSCKLDKDENGKSVDLKLYRGMIGSLLYLTANRPNILFSVCIYIRFQSDLKESSLNAVKKILKYLKGTQILGLWFFKQSSIDLIGYSDADFVGCKLDRKSTSETYQFVGVNLILWFSKK